MVVCFRSLCVMLSLLLRVDRLNSGLARSVIRESLAPIYSTYTKISKLIVLDSSEIDGI
jgi:hypothetical protein